MNPSGTEVETALIIIGVLAVAPHVVAGWMLLSGRWKISTPTKPVPPKTPAAASAEAAPEAAADQAEPLARVA